MSAIHTVATAIEKLHHRYVVDLDRLRAEHGAALVGQALALVRQRELRQHMQASAARHRRHAQQQEAGQT